MLKINKKIITFLFLISLIPSFSSAQVGGVNLPQVFIATYIEQNGITSAPTDDSSRLTSEAIRSTLAEYYDNMPAQDMQMLINNDPTLKQTFISQVTQSWANNYVRDQAIVQQQNTQNNTSNSRVDDVTDPTSENFQIVPANCYGTKGTTLSVEAKNKGDCGWKDLIALLNRIMMFLVYITASLSALAFAYAGFLYMTAFGNSGKIEQAHGIFSKTMIGILFVLLGWLLVATLLKVLGVNDSFSLLNASDVTGL